jgi:hypothetical protein
MIYMPNLIKIGSAILKFIFGKAGFTDIQCSHKPIFFFKIKKVDVKMEKEGKMNERIKEEQGVM